MKKRRKLRYFLPELVLLLVLSFLPIQAAEWPQEVVIDGETAIVMEASSGTVLYEKNPHAKRYPASITKIMTALLALENSSLEEQVLFSEDAIFKTEGSGIARDVGEVMTMEQCLYALMLHSSNECAYAIAEHVGGDYETFIGMMNDKAKALGCQETHFNNPHGLPDEEHYTSVYDMALISKEALKNETFCKIAGTKSYTIPATNKHKEETYITNTHKMLNAYKGPEYLYEGCIGGKTGYTSAAKNTLVTFARREEMTLICVVLNEEMTKQYSDTTALFDYCFANFKVWNVAENEERSLSDIKAQISTAEGKEIMLDPSGCIVLPKSVAYTDAVIEVKENPKGVNKLGALVYTYGEHSAGGADILLNRVKTPPIGSAFLSLIPLKEIHAREMQRAQTRMIRRIIFGSLEIILLLCAGIGLYCFADKFYLMRYKIRSRKQGVLRKPMSPRRRNRTGRRRKSRTGRLRGN